MKTFLLVVKILIPIAFFVIANLEEKIAGNAIAGIMTILVIGAYVLEHFNKEK